MNKNKIIIIGSGGHALSCLDLISKSKNFEFVGVVEIDEKQSGVKNDIFKNYLLGTDRDLPNLKKITSYIVIGIGQIRDLYKRMEMFINLKKLDYVIPNIKSNFSYISDNVKLGNGNQIFNNVTINSSVIIGDNNIFNTSSVIEHGVKIGNNCHISTGAIINGDCEIGDNTFIGSGAIISNNVKINKFSFIKAGEVIKK